MSTILARAAKGMLLIGKRGETRRLARRPIIGHDGKRDTLRLSIHFTAKQINDHAR
ncbi:hypothetical protein [Accumulibacter sp.]|uniref:hypothetical protein n=1 Tax=Accumulibacter sp. TaxID=2053492 RepID=UPI00261A198C|nr:hypothetical protein [Accumulibacter sp.]